MSETRDSQSSMLKLWSISGFNCYPFIKVPRYCCLVRKQHRMLVSLLQKKDSNLGNCLNRPLEVRHLVARLPLLVYDDQAGDLLRHRVKDRFDRLGVEDWHLQANIWILFQKKLILLVTEIIEKINLRYWAWFCYNLFQCVPNISRYS